MPVIVFFDEMDSIFRTRGAGPEAILDGTFVRSYSARPTGSSTGQAPGSTPPCNYAAA